MAVFAAWSAALSAAVNAAEPDPRMTKSNIRFDCHMTQLSYKPATSQDGAISLTVETGNMKHRPIMSQQLILRKTDVTAVSLLFTALSNDCRVGILNL